MAPKSKPTPLPQRGLARRLALLSASPRLALLTLFFLAVVSFFALRLYRLQVVETDYWVARAQEQRARLVRLPATRGGIYSRDGEPLVRNVPAFRVTVVPALLPIDALERETVLRRLASLLDQPYSQPEGPPGLLEKVRQGWVIGPYEPAVVAEGVDRETALIIARPGPHPAGRAGGRRLQTSVSLRRADLPVGGLPGADSGRAGRGLPSPRL